MKPSHALVATILAACGGVPVVSPHAAAAPVVSVAPPASAAPATIPSASASVTSPAAPVARASLVAQAKVEADGLGWTSDGARLALVKGGVLTLREGRDLAPVAGLTGGVAKAPRGFGPVLTASKGTLLVVGGVAFELPSGRRLELPLPKGADCDAPVYSADGTRASANCVENGAEEVIVLDAGNAAVLGRYDEFHTAAPVRAASLTASGKFLQWRSRASGAFEEISSHVTGPEVGSQAVMSPDERYLFLAVDLDWYTEDRTPPKLVTSRDGRPVAVLPRWIRSVDFSPQGSLFLARASSHADLAKAAPARAVVYQSGTGVPLLSIDVPTVDVTRAVFSNDERKLAILAKDGVLRVFALEIP